MLKNLLLILTLSASLSVLGQSTKKVLFIGNSYTGVNNLPNMIYQAAASVQDVLIFDSHTPGGARLMHHSADATVMSKMASNNWDHVVIQAQSQEPSWGLGQMQTELYPHAKILCDTIRHFNSCSEPMFYMTWGRKNGDASNCQFAPWVCTYEGMDSALRASYTYMATTNDAEISPVGPVWRYIRKNYSNIELYSSDESHPSLAGSYAAAVAFYTVIFDKDPTNITWNSTLAAPVADSIKMAAKRMVFDSLSYWDHTINNVTANFSYTKIAESVHFTSLNTNVDSVRWFFGDGGTSTQLNVTHTYTSTGTFQVTLHTYLCNKKANETQSVVIDSITGISDRSDVSLQVEAYPNPAKDKLNVNINEAQNSEFTIQIIDVVGNRVFQEVISATHHQINLNQLPKGIYLLQVSNKERQFVKKFVKQ
jgi:hypothetical protein